MFNHTSFHNIILLELTSNCILYNTNSDLIMLKHMKCFNDEIMLFSGSYMKQSWTLSLRVRDSYRFCPGILCSIFVDSALAVSSFSM